jgi:hypothetical protein
MIAIYPANRERPTFACYNPLGSKCVIVTVVSLILERRIVTAKDCHHLSISWQSVVSIKYEWIGFTVREVIEQIEFADYLWHSLFTPRPVHRLPPHKLANLPYTHNAAAVIVGHNHPSGVSEPSEADRSITLRLAKALALVEVRLLDHLVVSRGGHVSLAERGWL